MGEARNTGAARVKGHAKAATTRWNVGLIRVGRRIIEWKEEGGAQHATLPVRMLD